jgi:hypothetical protein
MRSALRRLLLACGLAAVAAVGVPSIAAAAAPRGSLTVAEYDMVLAALQRSEALEDDRTPTRDELKTMCDPLAPRPTALISAMHAVCLGGLSLWQISTGKGCASKDTRCVTRGLRQLETGLRSLVRLTRAQRRVVAERGLAGQCASAINGPPEMPTYLEAYANAVRDLRRAFIAGSERLLERALARMQRVGELGEDIEDDDTVALVATCPRV